MKTKYLLCLVILLAMGGSLSAQVGQQGIASNPLGGDLTATSSTCATVQSCVWMRLPSNGSTATVTLAGTFVQTDLIELSGDGGNTWTTNATLSAVGITSVSVNGFSDIRVRCSAFTSGRASVTINVGLLQVQSVVSSASSSGAALPATCTPGVTNPINLTTAPYGAFYCRATNTWARSPRIDVAAFGASPTLADNSTAFTAAVAALNTAAFTPLGGITFKNQCSAQNASAVTLSCNVTINAGDAVLVYVMNSHLARTFTVTDSGGSTYIPLSALAVNGSSGVTLWGSIPTATKASTSVQIVNSGAAEIVAMGVATYGNVGGYDNLGQLASGSSTAPSNTIVIRNNNDWVVTGFGWFSGAADTLSANVGNVRVNLPAAVSAQGVAIIDATAASMGTSVTNSGTLSVSTTWQGESIELLSGTPSWPTLYFGEPGTYNYSGGLNPLFPSQLSGDSCSAILNYTGNAHAVDLGPTGLTGLTGQKPYFVNGLGFTGGANMTYGIYAQPYTEWVGMSYDCFTNFGNSTSYMVANGHDTWDWEFGPFNRVLVDDFVPRNIMKSNVDGTDNNTFVRVHDNSVWCLTGHAAISPCNATQAGIGFNLDGAQNRVYHNNMMFWNPAVRFNGISAVSFGNQADQNQIEPASGGATPAIQFGGTQLGMLVTQNVVNMHGSTVGMVVPVAGSDLLVGARVNFNTMINMPLTTPVVTQNNLAGQSGNYSYMNECAAAAATMFPCALLHTTGGNISQWGFDNYPSCTLVAGTCTVTLSQNYGVLPRCTATWNGVGALAGILKAVPTAGNPNTVVLTSSNAADTAGMQLYCSSGDGQ